MNGNVTPAGNYKVLIELTDYDGTGKWTEVDFSNATATTLMPADTPYYTGMRLVLQ